MGVDIYSHAFIGCKVYKEDIFEVKVVKAFEHDYPSFYKLCPFTGRDLWSIKREMKPGFENDRYDNIKLGNYEVIRLDYSSDDYIIVLSSASTGTSRGGHSTGFKVGLPSAVEIDAFKAKLQEFEVWDEKNFGLWVQTQFS